MNRATMSIRRSAAIAVIAAAEAFAVAAQAFARAARRETLDFPCVGAAPSVEAEFGAAPRKLTHSCGRATSRPPQQKASGYG